MFSVSVDFTAIFLDVLKLTAGAGIAILTTMVANRYLLEREKLISEGQAKIKGKELLFNQYAKQSENIQVQTSSWASSWGKCEAELLLMTDDAQRNELMDNIYTIFSSGKELALYYASEVERELDEIGMDDPEAKEQISKFRRRMELQDFSDLDIQSKFRQLNELNNSLLLLNSIAQKTQLEYCRRLFEGK